MFCCRLVAISTHSSTSWIKDHISTMFFGHVCHGLISMITFFHKFFFFLQIRKVNLAHRVYSESSKIPPENKSYGFVTPWTVALQTHLSMEFSRQGCCSGLPFPSKGDLPDPQGSGSSSTPRDGAPCVAARFLTIWASREDLFYLWKWKSLSRVRLCDPTDYKDHGVLQARILEWVAYPFSSGPSWPGVEPGSPALQADSLPTEVP